MGVKTIISDCILSGFTKYVCALHDLFLLLHVYYSNAFSFCLISFIFHICHLWCLSLRFFFCHSAIGFKALKQLLLELYDVFKNVVFRLNISLFARNKTNGHNICLK